MKVLKFDDKLVPLILSGSKTSTWRLFDDKNLSVDDEVEFKIFGSNKTFAYAKLLKVVEKSFSELNNEDKDGHESFRDDEDMYQTYSRYYDTDVNSDTKLKIIHFQLQK